MTVRNFWAVWTFLVGVLSLVWAVTGSVRWAAGAAGFVAVAAAAVLLYDLEEKP